MSEYRPPTFPFEPVLFITSVLTYLSTPYWLVRTSGLFLLPFILGTVGIILAWVLNDCSPRITHPLAATLLLVGVFGPLLASCLL